ncbi:DNA recombination and repair protein RecO [Thioalkalivibrio nitratireducens DSM 14787]|uniref:DNA repair protein RecO n=1 Tax=Thioalkalivibrio nitratireducens (strain DSM 14787 / UNIQEM 213 / ALEN2) TaxID=1255043 RepID=L0DU49_THIND|nr:recombination protein O N-terminal domain-containing protein [Thioalkalivibrio nitratireducens]AGA32520.1 DNA recombination and repair protein RecO [Thioalkalivibrio nitratireducens DSM 14787]
MTGGQRELVPGFVLHARPFRENSRVLELITASAGRVTVLARGRTGSLRPFVLLDVAWRGRGELPNLAVGEERRVFPLAGRALVCALYLNELVLRLIPRDAGEGGIVAVLEKAYGGLLTADRPEHPLRVAEWSLLCLVDSGLEHLASEGVNPAAHYAYRPEQGLSGPLPWNSPGAVPGAVLLALASGAGVPDNAQRAARDFMRRLIDAHLDGREIHTRRLL